MNSIYTFLFTINKLYSTYGKQHVHSVQRISSLLINTCVGLEVVECLPSTYKTKGFS